MAEEAKEEVKFGASVEGLVAGVNVVKEKLESLFGPVNDLRESMHGLAEVFLVTFAVEGIVEFVNKMAELGEATERVSKSFGITAEQVGELQSIAKLTGTDFGQMSRATVLLEQNLIAGEKAGTKQAQALHNLGLSAREVLAMPIEERWRAIAEATAKWADGGAKLDNVGALVGNRLAQNIIPALDKGAEGFDEMTEAMHKTGDFLSDDMMKRFTAVKEKLTTFGMAMEGLGIKVFNALEPMITSVITWGTDMVASFNAQTINAAVLAVVNGVGEGIRVLGSFALQVLAIIQEVTGSVRNLGVMAGAITAGAVAGAGIGMMGGPITAGGGAVLGGAVGWMGLQIKQMIGQADQGKLDIDKMTAGLNASMDAFEHVFDRLKDKKAPASTNTDDIIDGSFGALGENPYPRPASERPKPELANVDPAMAAKIAAAKKAAEEQLAATKAELDGEVRLAATAEAQKQQLLNTQLQNHQINIQQWVQQSAAEADKEYEIEVALLNKELGLRGLKLAARQEVLNKLKELEQKHADEIAKIHQKSADESRKTWQSVADTISSAIGSQISGLLRGTETLGQALQNTALSIADTFIQSAIKTLVGNAANAFAGVFSNLAPAMGPAAAGPAAAAQGAVLAVGAAAGLAKGSWELPNDTVTTIHRGEMVTPAFEAGKFREAIDRINGGGGSSGQAGGDVHFHGSFFDAAGIAKALKQYQERNPSSRPSYSPP